MKNTHTHTHILPLPELSQLSALAVFDPLLALAQPCSSCQVMLLSCDMLLDNLFIRKIVVHGCCFELWHCCDAHPSLNVKHAFSFTVSGYHIMVQIEQWVRSLCSKCIFLWMLLPVFDAQSLQVGCCQCSQGAARKPGEKSVPIGVTPSRWRWQRKGHGLSQLGGHSSP